MNKLLHDEDGLSYELDIAFQILIKEKPIVFDISNMLNTMGAHFDSFAELESKEENKNIYNIEGQYEYEYEYEQ